MKIFAGIQFSIRRIKDKDNKFNGQVEIRTLLIFKITISAKSWTLTDN